MDNDTSTCSVRSSSVKVQKIFDQYMAQIAPIANSSNKENSFCISNDQRSNYHTRIQTPDKTTQRNSSQVQVIQALQKRNQELKFENDSLKEQLKNQQAISELSTFYQNLQQQYAQLDKDHKLLLQSYELQLSQQKQEKDQQIENINKLHKQQIEDLKLQMRSQLEKYQNIEGFRVDQEKLMTDTLDELRKERQLIAKLKLDQRIQLEECEQQSEKQLQYQQKLYQEIKSQNNILQKEKLEQQCQINELESTYKDLVQHQKQEIVKWQKQYTDIKLFFETQMKQVQEQVSNAMSDLRGKNESFLMQLSEQEQIIEDLEDMNQQLKQQILFKDQEILGVSSQLDELQIQHEKLKQMNEELVQSFNNQIEDLSLKLEREKEQSDFNESEKQEIYNAVHNQTDDEYKSLLQEIIDVEKEAYRLNNQYQILFQQFSKGGQDQTSIKQEMTDLMQQIRINNSRLYELKAKEFTYLS